MTHDPNAIHLSIIGTLVNDDGGPFSAALILNGVIVARCTHTYKDIAVDEVWRKFIRNTKVKDRTEDA